MYFGHNEDQRTIIIYEVYGNQRSLTLECKPSVIVILRSSGSCTRLKKCELKKFVKIPKYCYLVRDNCPKMSIFANELAE